MAKITCPESRLFGHLIALGTGSETPHQHVLRKRIERAKEFLRNSRFSVIEASARTGFVDQNHFSKVFRRIVGIAPSSKFIDHRSLRVRVRIRNLILFAFGDVGNYVRGIL